MINSYKEQLLAGDQLSPQVRTNGKQSTFYAPIMTNRLCLSCHGNRGDMEDYQIISDLYPKDLAYDYNVGDLRGIWSVTFLE